MAECISCGREFYNLEPGQKCAAICRGHVEPAPSPTGEKPE